MPRTTRCFFIATTPLRPAPRRDGLGQGKPIPLRTPCPVQRLHGGRFVHLRFLIPILVQRGAKCPLSGNVKLTKRKAPRFAAPSSFLSVQWISGDPHAFRIRPGKWKP
jgi:hypothetical protein